MGKRTNLLGALAATLLVALQKVAELLIVLAFLLLDRHDVLERLAEILKVQVQVLLISGELGDLLRKNRDIPISKRLSKGKIQIRESFKWTNGLVITYLNDRKGGTVGRQNVDELRLELFLHKLVKVSLRSEENLELFALGKVLE